MIVSDGMKSRFCKDTKTPIRVFDDDVFMERLHLLDPFYGCLFKWGVFLDSYKRYESEDDYFRCYSRVKDEAIEDIKSSDAFLRFNTMCIQDIASSTDTHNIPQRNVFNTTNIGKTFISIDMVKANFYALREFDKGIFYGEDSWEDFLGRYTKDTHMLNSKYIRQVIMGNCNPKRQVTYEKYLMSLCLSRLLASGLDIDSVVSFSSDEIIVQGTEKEEQLIVDSLKDVSIPLRIELYTLDYCGVDVYLRVNKNTSIMDIKCANPVTIPFVARYLRGESVKESDCIFMYEGRKAKLLDIPVISRT